ncbi:MULTISPECIES: hypothetical protein [Streptosporangium]|uniref:Bacteriophage T4 Gp32 single-stranded DNA-binding domain-containing protein n=1 Tax=Streptosporangium brasiliense TaxID=47480 RepID=A0ABT9RQ80_9ACTN|nr:hypothetical protein [Streptosporangium brasiliense]MDP9870440.1 hypothetical protein [Streptosporangium brasiliense]
MGRTLRRRSSESTAPASNHDSEPEEDYEDEEEAPRRTRTAGRRPAGRSGRESTRPAGRANSRTRDDAKPARRKSSAGSAEGGWETFRNKAKSGKFAENFKIDNDEIVIKFLEEGPFAVYQQHWLKEAEGRKSYVCLEEDCPLCDDLGDEPRYQILFNVVDFSNPEKPTVKVWACGVRVAQKLEGLSENKKTGPLNRDDTYWVVSKSGKGTKTEYNLRPVRAHSLADEEDIEPLDEEELAEFAAQAAGPETVKQDSREDLEELVDELS